MQFTKFLVAASAFAVASAVQFGMTASQFVAVEVGQTFNISWSAASGPVTLLLKNGPANILETYSTIATGLTGTSYSWSIPSTLPVDTYALEITDSTATPNYSAQFIISGGPALSSSSTAASSTSAASSSSASNVASTTSGTSTGLITSTTMSASTASSTGSASSTTGSSSTGSSSKTSTASSTSASSTSTTPATNSAAGVASPLALVLLAFAALITLN